MRTKHFKKSVPTIIEQGNTSNEDQNASAVRYETEKSQTGEDEVIAYKSDDSGKLSFDGNTQNDSSSQAAGENKGPLFFLSQ